MAIQQRTAVPAAAKTPAKKQEPEVPDIQTIRDAIPAHCFEASLTTSFYYVVRDLTMVAGLVWAALTWIPAVPAEVPGGRFAAWMLYGWLQGLVCTGVWILGHECGHGAFSRYNRLNNVVGWCLHSFLLVPYFSWKYSHHRHHRFTGHMDKDMAFVPLTAPAASTASTGGLASSKCGAAPARTLEDPTSKAWFSSVDLNELFEDTPVAQLAQLLSHQLFGWQMYLFTNATAGKASQQRPTTGLTSWLRVSHFDPHSAVFRPSEAPFVALSDLGLVLMATALYFAGQAVGSVNMVYLYVVPYFWVHHWLVAITYLHHNHPEVPHYTEESWSYVKGSLATIDREFGFIGKHIFHGIIEKHVVHHLFPRIPFYKADEATEAIKPLLGDLYHRDDRSFLGQLWSVFGTLKYVEDDPDCRGVMRWAN